MHADGGGLYLQVTAGKDGQTNKSWLFRFERKGHERQMGLGSLQTIGLGEAREEAERQRKLLLEGHDRIEVRDAVKAAQNIVKAKAVTFEWCAVRYMSAHEAGWRNAKHRQQWHNTLATYAYPVIGGIPIDEVGTGLVMQILEPLWTEKNETASRAGAAVGADSRVHG
jgi:hypothetical protein